MMETDTTGSKLTEAQARAAQLQVQEPAKVDLEYVHGDARISIIGEPEGLLVYGG
jgi:hypothetical protein